MRASGPPFTGHYSTPSLIHRELCKCGWMWADECKKLEKCGLNQGMPKYEETTGSAGKSMKWRDYYDQVVHEPTAEDWDNYESREQASCEYDNTIFDFRGAENFPKPKGYEEASKNFKWDEEKENWVKVEGPPVVHTPYEFLPENSVDLGKVCRDVVEDLVKDSKSTQVGGTHYAEMSVQPWDAMRAWMSPEEYTGYHVGTVLGYLSRHKKKGGLTDIQKAKHHLEELIRYFEVDEEYPY